MDRKKKRGNKKTFKIEEPLIHEDFYQGYNNDMHFYSKNDIALIKLKKTVKTPFIAINNNPKLVKTGIKGYAFGWGNINNDELSHTQNSNELLNIDLTIDLYPNNIIFTGNNFFVYRENKGRLSFGDS